MGSKLTVQDGHGSSGQHTRSGTRHRPRTSARVERKSQRLPTATQVPAQVACRTTRRSSPLTSSSTYSYSTTSTSQSSSLHPSETSRPSPHESPPVPPTVSHGATSDQQRRIHTAERILAGIANEYAVKRAAGLVPTRPVPARTLLWEELARNATTRVAKRGQCVFGRDHSTLCGCVTYQKKRNMADQNPGAICACCHHGGAWHRLHGGGNLRASTQTVLRRNSDMYEGGSMSDSEEYYSESDGEEDDEAIANEVARPYTYTSNSSRQEDGMPMVPSRSRGARHGSMNSTTGGALMRPRTSFVDCMDRGSFFSTTSSSGFGFPTRLSSGPQSLQTFLQTMQRYRQQGMSEEEIEHRIQHEFPPTRTSISSLVRQNS